MVQLTNQLNGQKQIQVTADLGGTRHPRDSSRRRADPGAIVGGSPPRPTSNPPDVDVNQVRCHLGLENVTTKAIQALIIFFILVTAYISIRFEFRSWPWPPSWR